MAPGATTPPGRDRADDGPGLAGLPDLTDLDVFAHGFPHAAFRTLRNEAPVFWHEPTPNTPDGEGFWVLSRYDDVQAVAGDAATFSSDGSQVRATGGGTLIEDLPGGFGAGVLLNMMDDPRHQRIRQLITPALSPRGLAALEPELTRRADALVDAAVAKGDVDLVTDLAAELPLQAVALLLGVPEDDRHQLFAWSDTNLDYDDHDLGETTARQQEASAAMFAYGTELVAEKRAHPDGSILATLAAATIDDGSGPGPLTELELQMLFNLLMAAGTETTRNTIALGVLGVLEQPGTWPVLAEDPAGTAPAAAEELLRWASSTTYNRRTATRDTEVAGTPIRAGDKVTLWWGSANHDERQFPDPGSLDPARSPNRHLAFGHGGHFCLGAGLARLEIRLVLERLVARSAEPELLGPPEHVRSNKHTGLRHLPVRLHPC